MTSLNSPSHAQSVGDLPKPGTMVSLSPAFEPVLLKGLQVNPQNPFTFNFILDSGDSSVTPSVVEVNHLIKYFLASMTVPEKDLWVNLSPYEKDRMIADNLGQTEMGRDMLAQDYLLKQVTASLIYPEKELGKKFWDKVYAQAQGLYGKTQVPVNTFNKVWIVADRADIFERDNVAYITGAHLKVMLEEDYLAASKQTQSTPASQIIRQIIIPEIEKEVNTGKHFAPLRQMFYAMILASWYKMVLKENVLTQIYGNKNKVKVGVNADDLTAKNAIFDRYIEAYKKGVFNFIKEGRDEVTQEPMPRKYFSGGLQMFRDGDAAQVIHRNQNIPTGDIASGKISIAKVTLDLAMAMPPKENSQKSKPQTPDLFRENSQIQLNHRQIKEWVRSAQERKFPAKKLKVLSRLLRESEDILKLVSEPSGDITELKTKSGILYRKVRAVTNSYIPDHMKNSMPQPDWAMTTVFKPFSFSDLNGFNVQEQPIFKSISITAKERFWWLEMYVASKEPSAEQKRGTQVFILKLFSQKKTGKPNELLSLMSSEFPQSSRVHKVASDIIFKIIEKLTSNISNGVNLPSKDFIPALMNDIKHVASEELSDKIRPKRRKLEPIVQIEKKEDTSHLVFNPSEIFALIRQNYAETMRHKELARQKSSISEETYAEIERLADEMEGIFESAKAQVTINLLERSDQIRIKVRDMVNTYKGNPDGAMLSTKGSFISSDYKALKPKRKAKIEEAAMPAKPRILFVDDQPMFVQPIIEMLEEEGYEVVQAMNGEEALKLFKKGKFKGILSDYQMPRMTGVQLFVEIRKISNVPFIIQSNDVLALKAKLEELKINKIQLLDKGEFPKVGIKVVRKLISLDHAQTTQGGIDLDPSKMQVNISKDAAMGGLDVKVGSGIIERIKREGFEGLEFQIQSITPVRDLPLLLGINQSEGKLAKIS